jgi:hypothetical protein
VVRRCASTSSAARRTARQAQDTQAALADLMMLANELLRLRERTGRARVVVVT